LAHLAWTLAVPALTPALTAASLGNFRGRTGLVTLRFQDLHPWHLQIPISSFSFDRSDSGSRVGRLPVPHRYLRYLPCGNLFRARGRNRTSHHRPTRSGENMGAGGVAVM